MNKIKNILSTLALLILFSSVSVGQNCDGKKLVLYNSETAKTKTICEGQRIRIWCNDTLYKGAFYVSNDSTIIMSADTISLDNIDEIRCAEKNKRAIGHGLIWINAGLGGTIGILAGVKDDLGLLVVAVGVGFVGAIQLPFAIALIAGKKTEINKITSISIK